MKRYKTATQIITLSGALALGGFALHGQAKASRTDEAGKRWLALMDKDNDMTVDKKEFLDYLGKEFDMADADHDGTLDTHELGVLREKLSIRK
jgi:Ca2+-binding EF-hand superfamily protein